MISAIGGRMAYVDTPELLNRVEGDDLLQQIIPVVTLNLQSIQENGEVQAQTRLSTRWLGEPQSPLVHERMQDIKVVLIVEDGDLLILAPWRFWLLVLIAAFWGDGDGGQVNRR